MKKQIAIAYLIVIHILLIIILLKNDFVNLIHDGPGFHKISFPSEIMQLSKYHKRMDGNVPDNAVIFIGDSIIQGLCVSAIVTPSVNYGIANDTTVGVLQRILYYGSIERASLVVLAVGINDMKHRSNKEILRNYRAIIELIPNLTPILFSSILPLDMKAREEWQGRSQDRIKRLNSSIEKMTQKANNLYFVDAGPLLLDGNGNLSDVYHDGDGVHLNSKGNSILIKVLRSGIRMAQQPTLEKLR